MIHVHKGMDVRISLAFLNVVVPDSSIHTLYFDIYLVDELLIYGVEILVLLVKRLQLCLQLFYS